MISNNEKVHKREEGKDAAIAPKIFIFQTEDLHFEIRVIASWPSSQRKSTLTHHHQAVIYCGFVAGESLRHPDVQVQGHGDVVGGQFVDDSQVHHGVELGSGGA